MTGVRDFPARVKCAPLSWHTVHAALNDQKKSTEYTQNQTGVEETSTPVRFSTAPLITDSSS
jgi:hypothetical protein